MMTYLSKVRRYRIQKTQRGYECQRLRGLFKKKWKNILYGMESFDNQKEAVDWLIYYVTTTFPNTRYSIEYNEE